MAMTFTEDECKKAKYLAWLINRASFRDLATLDIIQAQKVFDWYNEFSLEMPDHIMELVKIVEPQDAGQPAQS